MFDLACCERRLTAQRLDVQYFDRHLVRTPEFTRVTTDVDVLKRLSAPDATADPPAHLCGDRHVSAQPGPHADSRGHHARGGAENGGDVARIEQLLQPPPGGGEDQLLSPGARERDVRAAAVQSGKRRSTEEFGNYAEHMVAFKDSIFAYGWFYPVVEFLSMLAIALMLAWGGFRIVNGAMTVGVLVRSSSMGCGFCSIQDLSEKYNILQGAMAAAERIFKLLDTPAHVLSPASPRPTSAEGIEFDHVWFAYNDEDWVLGGMKLPDCAGRDNRGGRAHGGGGRQR